MKVESIAELEHSAILDLHEAIIGLENQFVAFLRVVVLHRVYCIHAFLSQIPCINANDLSSWYVTSGM